MCDLRLSIEIVGLGPTLTSQSCCNPKSKISFSVAIMNTKYCFNLSSSKIKKKIWQSTYSENSDQFSATSAVCDSRIASHNRSTPDAWPQALKKLPTSRPSSTETSPWSTSVEIDSRKWRETATMTRPNVHVHRSLFKSEQHVDSTVSANQRRPSGAQTRGRSPSTTLLAAGAEMRDDVVESNAVDVILLLPLLLPRSVPLASWMSGRNRR